MLSVHLGVTKMSRVHVVHAAISILVLHTGDGLLRVSAPQPFV